MYVTGWRVKQTVIYPYHELLLSDKKGQINDTCNNLHGSQDNYAEWKSIPNYRIVYYSSNITFLELQIYRHGK